MGRTVQSSDSLYEEFVDGTPTNRVYAKFAVARPRSTKTQILGDPRYRLRPWPRTRPSKAAPTPPDEREAFVRGFFGEEYLAELSGLAIRYLRTRLGFGVAAEEEE